MVSVVDEVRQFAWISEFLVDQMAPACMQEQGFEYWAMLPQGGGVPELEELELEYQAALEEDPDFVPFDGAVARNIEYTDGLDPATLSAYNAALIGGGSDEQWITIEHSDGAVSSYPTTGCLAEGRLRLMSQDEFLLLQDSLVEFEGLTFEIDDRVYATAAFQEGSDELESCLTDEGYEFVDVRMDMYADINADLEPAAAAVLSGCADRLGLEDRVQEMQDRAAFEMLDEPRVEQLVIAWEERRASMIQTFAEAERDFLE